MNFTKYYQFREAMEQPTLPADAIRNAGSQQEKMALLQKYNDEMAAWQKYARLSPQERDTADRVIAAMRDAMQQQQGQPAQQGQQGHEEMYAKLSPAERANADQIIAAMRQDPRYKQFQAQQGQAQPQMQQQQGQAQQGQGVNPRTDFMIDMANKVLGGNIPKTEEGYNQLGRSQGFLQVMSNMEGWTKLQKHIANIDSQTWNRVPVNVRQDLLSKLVTGVSRSQ